MFGEHLPTRRASNGVAAFHDGTEEALLWHVNITAKKGDPASVINTVDTFCYNQHWMMHMGEQKAEVVKNELRKAKELFKKNHPGERFCVVELGSYCGYSATVIASHLNVEDGDHLYCIEVSAECARWTRRMLEYGNLLNRVTVINSAANDVDRWKEQINSAFIDFLFIDHDKAAYYTDLIEIERNGLLRSGSVVVADNVLSFNRPKVDYLNHVRKPYGPYHSSVLYEGYLEYTTNEDRKDSVTKDGIEVSIFGSKPSSYPN
eukprot:TRINITY_DN17444_c0_g1_i1.p1 TRINITY_DN17444_c0_g1~~TRINITY_DN17444_c0_g1_i1.p1  ORF type:complete len:262 (-),score=24.63 TRINITY_DN17444_c0_g1_i1:47-832(-)